jgi:hypothetical protein
MGWGSGAAMSLAVKKIDEPMIPLTSNKTESSKPSPRTRVGFSDGDPTSGDKAAVDSVIPSPVRRQIPAAYRNGGKSQQNSRRK